VLLDHREAKVPQALLGKLAVLVLQAQQELLEQLDKLVLQEHLDLQAQLGQQALLAQLAWDYPAPMEQQVLLGQVVLVLLVFKGCLAT
jgi:hypothetical protein